MADKIEEPKVGHYYDAESLNYLYCFTCLMIVLDKSEKATGLFKEIKKSWELPGCKQFVNRVLGSTLYSPKFLPTGLRLVGLDPKKNRTMQMNDIKAMISGVRRLTSLIIFREKLRLFFAQSKWRDYQTLRKLVDELVKIGFNRESDRTKGSYKITVKRSRTLAETIYLYSLSDAKMIDLGIFSKLVKLPAVNKRNNNYTFEQLINNKAPRRTHKKLVEEYKENGFKLKDEEAIARNAYDWCQSRIFYTGIEEYCKSSDNKYSTDSANVSRKIKECDEALGYPRGNKVTK